MPKEDFFLLDVREPHEIPIANLGAPFIPVGELEKRVGELAAQKDRRGRHPLPLRRTQPEGRADPEECRLHRTSRISPEASSPGPTRSTPPCRSTKDGITPIKADKHRSKTALIVSIGVDRCSLLPQRLLRLVVNRQNLQAQRTFQHAVHLRHRRDRLLNRRCQARLRRDDERQPMLGMPGCCSRESMFAPTLASAPAIPATIPGLSSTTNRR